MAIREAGARLAVLGGCGGIGRAVVARAVAQGWRVSVLDLPASLDRHGVPAGVQAVGVNGTDEASVAAAFGAVAEATDGALDGFVNLAGWQIGLKPLAETPVAEWDEVFAGNMRTAFLSARAALPLLRRGRDAAMVQISSGLAANTRPGYGPYAAAKAAMISMTKTLALESAPAVRVNAVAPAAVDTAFLRGGTGRSDEGGRSSIDTAAYAAMIPLRRLAVAEDIVGPVFFMLGPDSGYVTGQVLWVNGGGYMP
jgi:NAD(P)-dependent dehydrogenase (short-subunit alcohol dehydrogenase family)